MDLTPIAKAVVAHIARYNAQNVDLNDVYLFIALDGSHAEFTTQRDFTTLDNAVLFGTLSEIDPSALICENDTQSQFVIECVREMLEDFDFTLGAQPQYHLQ